VIDRVAPVRRGLQEDVGDDNDNGSDQSKAVAERDRTHAKPLASEPPAEGALLLAVPAHGTGDRRGVRSRPPPRRHRSEVHEKW